MRALLPPNGASGLDEAVLKLIRLWIYLGSALLAVFMRIILVAMSFVRMCIIHSVDSMKSDVIRNKRGNVFWIWVCFLLKPSIAVLQFTSVFPSHVSAFGGNTLQISGSGFPTPTVEGIVLCFWQDAVSLGGTYVNESFIECPVPAIFLFTPFSVTGSYSLNDLKVGFDVNSTPSNYVLGGDSQLQISTRAVADEMYPISVRPKMTLAGFENLTVWIRGSGFPTSGPAVCQFSLILRNGSVFGSGFHISEATVANDTDLSCLAPNLSAIDDSVVPPANAVIKVSFDGGQTFGKTQAGGGFAYLPHFTVWQVSPNLTMSGENVSISLFGFNFFASALLSCKFQSTTDHYIILNAVYVSAEMMRCEQREELQAGNYQVYVSVDRENFFSTNFSVIVVPPPAAGTISPSRGPYHGGTLVTITGSEMLNSSSTKCYFGPSPTNLTNFINSTTVQCLSPSCYTAMPSHLGRQPELCSGNVTVRVVFGSPADGYKSAPVFFQYTPQQIIHAMEPWYASAWDAPFPVRIFGEGFSAPLFFRWLDLDPVVEASNISNQSADCVAPVLPERYRPSQASGVDWVMAYLEVSPNGVDFTSRRTQWIFYHPPIVDGFSPESILAGGSSPVALTVFGSHFVNMNAQALACLWKFEEKNITITTEATFLDSKKILCAPLLANFSSPPIVEVLITPGVTSSAKLSLSVFPVPVVSNISTATGPYLGGDLMTVSFEASYPLLLSTPVYVAIGDVPVLARPMNASFLQMRVPPSPHGEGSTSPSFPITLVLNDHDRVPLSDFSYTYAPVSAGSWYRPEIHQGSPVPCQSGQFCAGGSPSSDSGSDFSVLVAGECVPGTFQSSSSASSCDPCPTPSFCPSYAQTAPSACPPHAVCWWTEKNKAADAHLPTCPLGKICPLPAEFQTPIEIPPSVDPFAPFDEEGQLPARNLAAVVTTNNNLLQDPCPGGYICPPNSVALTQLPSCSIPGLFCAPGTASPLAIDLIVPPGSYVSRDSILDCPLGTFCSQPSIPMPALCLPGSYGNLTGQARCAACQGGTVCPSAGLSLPQSCPPGFVCSLPGDVQPNYLCPPGAYCLGSVLTLNTSAPFFQPHICQPGLYCSAGTSTATPDLTNPSAPRLCAVGFFCQEGQSNYRGSGICPVGFFCVAGSVVPVVAPKGYYVSYPGAYSPTPCAPGTFQDGLGQARCLPCPEGFECLGEGTVVPSACALAHYRSNSDASFKGSNNVNCHPCPEGTWSSVGGLKSSSLCQVCPERYVCGKQGISVFAAIGEPNYENSQATPCPEGFACAAGTTSFTQLSFPCEAGYFCKSLTAVKEMRFLLCPKGFVCKQATGFSKAFSIECPPGYFCPEGTAGEANADGSLTLYNVQALKNVGEVNPVTKAVCRTCDPNTFVPPDNVDVTNCGFCGQSGNNYFSLLCPDGTDSAAGSTSVADCLQKGLVLAVVNIYNSSGVVRNTTLWDPFREGQWINESSAGYAAKQTLQYGKPIPVESDPAETIVDFVAYDPRSSQTAASEFHFVSVEMNALDIMHLDLNFSKVPPNAVLGGNFLLQISSDKISTAASYLLPCTLDQGTGVLLGEVSLKLTALMDKVKVNVSVSVLDGGLYPDLHLFNNSANLTLISPNRSEAGSANSFYAIIASSALNAGGYELPFNMIPTLANQPGDLSLVVDLADRKNLTIDRSLVDKMMPGTTFWQIAGASTVAVPWLPFFSNCDYFDRHMNIWDLIENGNTLIPPSAGQCVVVPQDEVRTVAPWVYDLSAKKFIFEPLADYCEIAIQCRYEDNLQLSAGSSTPWMTIPGSGTNPLYYLTQDPLSFSKAAFPDFRSSLGVFDSQEGSDSLIPVILDAGQRTGSFPRLISLTVNYDQATTGTKRLVKAGIKFSNFDNNASDPNYLLQISFEPMNWMQLMNKIHLPIYVYVLVFGLVGFGIVGCGLAAWMILKLLKGNTVYPNLTLADAASFFLGFPIQGIFVSAIPVFFLVGLIKVVFLPQVGFLQTIPCSWPRGSTSTTSVTISGTSNNDVCRPMRTGTCLIFAGVFLAWSASFFFTPRLPDAQKEYLEHSASANLQDDGILYPARKGYVSYILKTVLKWKRMHMFFMLLLMCLPIMVIFYLSYSAMFGNFTVFYVIGYTVTMLFCDLLYVKSAREKFGFEALNVVTDIAFFLATFSAVDLNAFILSFLYGQFFIITQRLIAELILNYLYEDGIPDLTNWIKTRNFVWNLVLYVKDLERRIRHQPRVSAATTSGAARIMQREQKADSALLKGDSKFLQYSEIRQPALPGTRYLLNHDKIHQFRNLDQSIDQIMGVAARTSSLVFAPLAVIIMWIFASETQFLSNYGLRNSDMPTYLLFSFMMVPFQISLEMIINHAFDSSRNMKIYDYMYFSIWRWKNRLTRWLLDDTRLDQSFGESSQALHHLGFCPQFYFIVAYGVAGGIFILFGITCWIVNGVPGFLDPALPIIAALMFLAQRFADAITRWLVFYAVWAPRDRAPEKAFVQSIALGLKQRELEQHQTAFRNAFFNENREWLIQNLDKVYTPRGVAKYRSQLTEMYQRVVNLNIPFLYSAPTVEPPPPILEKPSDDSAQDFELFMHAGRSSQPLPVSSNLLVDKDSADLVNSITQSLVIGWFEVARKRVRSSRVQRVRRIGSLDIDTSRVDENANEVFPDWLVISLSTKSKELMKKWVQKARENVDARS